MQTFYLILEIIGLGMMIGAVILMVGPWSKLRDKQRRGESGEADDRKRKKYGYIMLLLIVLGLVFCFPHMSSIMSGQATY